MNLVFYCGHSLEPWSPASRDRGIGGSQEALIEVAEALAARGVTVRVYNHCGSECGDWNGVAYIPYKDFPSDGQADVVVIWRWPRLRLAIPPTFHARHFWVWMHDYVSDAELRGHLATLDRAIFVSRFHRSCYPFVPDSKTCVLRNGIVREHFEQQVQRDPYRVVYGSDYHRGLLPLLKAWPRIRKREPRASLRIFYGWQNQLRQAWRPAFGWKQWRQNNLITFAAFWLKTTVLMWRAGATHLGRISHQEVASEFLSAGVWAYPATFHETSCITAMKAQASGAWPVVIPTAALAETVQFGSKTNSVTLDAKTLNEWEELLVTALQGPSDEQRAQMQQWAKDHYSWPAVANEWLAALQEQLGAEQAGF